MPRHKHADQMIKLANNSDAVVWCKSRKKGEWVKLKGIGSASWNPENEYRTILPEFADMWQAFLDGELEFRPTHECEWEKWTITRGPNFNSPIENYRRTPSGEESSPDEEGPEKSDPQFRPCPCNDSKYRNLKSGEKIKVGDFFYALDRYDRLRLVEVLETTLTSSCFSLTGDEPYSDYLIECRVPPHIQIYRKV